jgi:hypothetical protein
MSRCVLFVFLEFIKVATFMKELVFGLAFAFFWIAFASVCGVDGVWDWKSFVGGIFWDWGLQVFFGDVSGGKFWMG